MLQKRQTVFSPLLPTSYTKTVCMTIYKFNQLDVVNKVDALIHHSVLIDKRTDQRYRILLYQLDGFYVEVYYDIEYNKISKIKSFSSTSLLKPYLSKIDISSIFILD